MNLPIEHLPAACDVLVVGAGPAGSAAAATLARAGLDVVLVDQQAFPRDKVCGDGLIPDAHHALRRLGVLDEVMAQAQSATRLACVAPRGGRVDVPGALAVLPRLQLDAIICRAAVAAGARMHAPARLAETVEDGGRVVGARLVHGDTARELRCRWVVLATGAQTQALLVCGILERRMPSSMAMRGYLRHPAATLPRDELQLVCRPSVRGGYGWIFPLRDGVFNVGVGIDAEGAGARSMRHRPNLRAAFDAFLNEHAPARELVAGGEWLAPPKGAPLRCSLEGAKPARAGVLVAGDAVGSTYAFTGEGIGKSLETGMLAAEALVEGHRAARSDAQVCAAYETRLLALKPRFALYKRAEFVTRHPWLVDLLVWRAQRSAKLRARMAGVLEETSNPGNLVSLKGFKRLFLE